MLRTTVLQRLWYYGLLVLTDKNRFVLIDGIEHVLF
jgi:hypothetical protein